MTEPQRKRRPDAGTSGAAGQKNAGPEDSKGPAGKASGQRAAFTAFKFKWLSQVAQDASLPALAARIAIRIADEHFNFEKGYAWPAVSTMARWLGKSENPIRNALSAMASSGHIKLRTTSGGRKQTHRIAPLVDGKPFRKLKGFDDENPSDSEAETLQKPGEKPFRNLKGTPCDEPYDEPRRALGARAYGDDHQYIDLLPEGSDALSCASGQGDLLRIGDEIEVGQYGACVVDDFGRLGRTNFVRARRVSATHIIILIPVARSGDLAVDEAGFEDEFRAEEFRSDNLIECRLPARPGRKSDAA